MWTGPEPHHFPATWSLCQYITLLWVLIQTTPFGPAQSKLFNISNPSGSYYYYYISFYIFLGYKFFPLENSCQRDAHISNLNLTINLFCSCRPFNRHTPAIFVLRPICQRHIGFISIPLKRDHKQPKWESSDLPHVFNSQDVIYRFKWQWGGAIPQDRPSKIFDEPKSSAPRPGKECELFPAGRQAKSGPVT